MNILLACEESQAVCIEMRKRGHNAYSCDLEPCSGGHPEWHIEGDAIHQLYKHEWGLVIAFPTCKFLANSGVKHLYKEGKKVNGWDWGRIRGMEAGAKFFNQFVLYGKTGGRVGIENPIQHGYAKELIAEKYAQIIQPYQFGHLEKKATCLWLFGLPKLQETNNVYDEMMKLEYKDRAKVHYCSPGPDRAKLRSKTFPGIARAMAEQWG